MMLVGIDLYPLGSPFTMSPTPSVQAQRSTHSHVGRGSAARHASRDTSPPRSAPCSRALAFAWCAHRPRGHARHPWSSRQRSGRPQSCPHYPPFARAALRCEGSKHHTLPPPLTRLPALRAPSDRSARRRAQVAYHCRRCAAHRQRRPGGAGHIGVDSRPRHGSQCGRQRGRLARVPTDGVRALPPRAGPAPCPALPRAKDRERGASGGSRG